MEVGEWREVEPGTVPCQGIGMDWMHGDAGCDIRHQCVAVARKEQSRAVKGEEKGRAGSMELIYQSSSSA